MHCSLFNGGQHGQIHSPASELNHAKPILSYLLFKIEGIGAIRQHAEPDVPSVLMISNVNGSSPCVQFTW